MTGELVQHDGKPWTVTWAEVQSDGHMLLSLSERLPCPQHPGHRFDPIQGCLDCADRRASQKPR